MPRHLNTTASSRRVPDSHATNKLGELWIIITLHTLHYITVFIFNFQLIVLSIYNDVIKTTTAAAAATTTTKTTTTIHFIHSFTFSQDNQAHIKRCSWSRCRISTSVLAFIISYGTKSLDENNTLVCRAHADLLHSQAYNASISLSASIHKICIIQWMHFCCNHAAPCSCLSAACVVPGAQEQKQKHLTPKS